MKKLFLLCCFISVFTRAQNVSQIDDEKAIIAVLDAQMNAWNNYDIESFMQGYWKSEELKFYGAGGVIKGWQSTLDRFKKSYPTKAHFGNLRFVYNDVSIINEGAYSVMGEYHLTRDVGDTNGIFMLILKKFDGEWKVIADTSAKVK
ncbi:YybH family protein [Croceitalea rosinachiae]|uniref:Nuclear transport factor 2 family protein n=1 Tax=Croceitalea rosinachiae TaxID=3075596 RepID=A0ABU3A7G8_9FLAO|nr:nuclear transport factor 2 family protein [Croceitalea sp. F388]MDT0606113.1 nuclear transport factor 2 family protein [Croceitalea sp. F388]